MLHVQKHPSANTIACTWPTLAEVPAGITTEKMTDDEFAEWLATQPPIVQPEPVPQSVSKRQLRAACIHAGIMPEQVAAALAKIADPVASALAVNDWDCATEYERGHPLIAQMATVFGLTSAQVDALFRSAAAY